MAALTGMRVTRFGRKLNVGGEGNQEGKMS